MGMSIFQFEDDKIKEAWIAFDISRRPHNIKHKKVTPEVSEDSRSRGDNNPPTTNQTIWM